MSRAYDIEAFRRAIGADRLRGQSRSGAPEEPRLLLVFADSQARARRRHRATSWSRRRARRKSRRVLAAAHRLAIPVTPRGGGTGNYGQAMPLSGGVVLNLAEMNQVLSIAPGRVVVRARRDHRRNRQGDGGERPGIAHVPFDPRDRLDRRLRRRRLGRRRLDHLGRPARFRQCSAPARADDGGEPARARTDRRGLAQGGARLRHQRRHRRGRNAADRRLRLGRRHRRLRRFRRGGRLWARARRAGRAAQEARHRRRRARAARLFPAPSAI